MFTDHGGDGGSVSQDRSLDEFVSSSGDVRSGTDEDPDETGHEEGVSRVDVTLSWSTASAACASCGELVERRWVSADGLVCESCKVW